MNTIVCLEVTFGGECSPTYFALVRSFASVDSIMQLEGILAAQHPMADDTLVWFCDLLFDTLNEML